MPEQDVILSIKAKGLDTFRNRFKAALGGLQSDIRRINRQTATEQLRSINSQISAQRRLGQIQRQIDTRRGADGRFISRQRIAALRRERQQLLANARVSRLTSSRQLIALRAQKTAFRDLQSSAAGFRNLLNRARIAAFAIGAIGLFLVVRRLKQAISLGINLNKEFEAMRVGVAATLAANTKITDSLGRQLTGFRAVVAAQQLSRKIQRQILSITIETGGTLETTLTAFRIALPLVLRVGGTLEDALDIVKRLNLAAIAIGIPIDLVRVQIDDILKGVITTRTLLAQVLGITQQQLKAAKEQGRLLEFIREKTQAFVDAQSLLVGKFAAVLNITKALGQEFSRLVTESAFEVLRRTLTDIIGQLVILDEKTGAFKGFRPEIQKSALELRKSIGDLTQTIRDSLPTVKEFVGVLNALALAARGTFGSEEFGTGIAKRIQSFFVVPGKRKTALFQLLFGFDSPEDLEREVEGEVKRIQAKAGLITAEPKFPQLTEKLLVTSARRLAQLKTRLDEAKDAADRFPRGVLRAQEAIDKFLSQFSPNDIKAIGDFANVIKRSGVESLKLRTRLDRVRDSLASLLQQQKIKRIGKLGILGLQALQDEKRELDKIIQSLDIAGGSEKTQAETIKTVINLLRQRERVENAITSAIEKGAKAQKKAFEDLEKFGISFFSEKLLKGIEETRKKILSSLTLKGDAQARLDVIRDQVRESFRSLAEDIGQAFSRIFGNILSQTQSFVASMRDILRSIVNAIIGTFISRLVTAAVERALGGLRNIVEKILKKNKSKLADVIRIIFGIPKEAKDQKEATKENTDKTVLNTTSTDKNTIAIDRLTSAMQVSGGGGQNFLGGFGFASLFNQPAGGGGQQGGIFSGGNPFSKQNRAATAALAAAGISQIIFAKSKTQKVGGALLTAAAFDPEPISKAILAITGTLLSAFGALFDTGARREKRRQGQVQAARERQAFSFLEPKTFSFANAARVRDVFSRTLLERPGGSFLAAPQQAGFSTGMPAGPMIQINMQISARTADDAQEIGEVVRRQFPELEEHIRRSTFTSSPLTSRLLQLANPV